MDNSITNKAGRQNLTIRMQPELRAEARKAAIDEGRSLSDVVEELLRNWLKVKVA